MKIRDEFFVQIVGNEFSVAPVSFSNFNNQLENGDQFSTVYFNTLSIRYSLIFLPYVDMFM